MSLRTCGDTKFGRFRRFKVRSIHPICQWSVNGVVLGGIGTRRGDKGRRMKKGRGGTLLCLGADELHSHGPELRRTLPLCDLLTFWPCPALPSPMFASHSLKLVSPLPSHLSISPPRLPLPPLFTPKVNSLRLTFPLQTDSGRVIKTFCKNFPPSENKWPGVKVFETRDSKFGQIAMET